VRIWEEWEGLLRSDMGEVDESCERLGILLKLVGFDRMK
jgi:hypothetical protein